MRVQDEATLPILYRGSSALWAPLGFLTMRLSRCVLRFACVLWTGLFLLLGGGRVYAAIPLPTVEPLEGFGLVEAFPGLRFQEPAGMVAPPGATNQLFIVERSGRVQVVTNLAAPTKTLFLDLTTKVWLESIETGLLGLAFHPGYATNRLFFVYRTQIMSTREAGRTQHFLLSRFKTSLENPYQALPESETVILAQADRTDSHNGGDLQFGADGYLYISTGENGPGLSPARNLSRIDAGLFGILRIDVDRRPGNLSPNPHPAATTNYAIPADNPFIGRTEYFGEAVDPNKVCTELYAVGLRNPWRLHLDAETGAIYAGDVGQQDYEEINLVTRGSNYGWPYREGLLSHALPEPLGYEPVAPLWSGERGWETNQAECVIGGMVYRGSKLPGLTGAYLFGSFRSGHVMAIRHQGNTLTDEMRLTGIRAGLSCFASDPRDREVLLANLFEGTIYRLAYQSPASSPVPQRLSELGAFSSLASLAPASGVIPYEINAPFWSDNALKRRFFSLPASGEPVQVDGNTGPWSFPVGMVWVKHFDIELTKGDPATARRLETRFLVKTLDGMYGLTYRWLSNNTDALLVGPDGDTEVFSVLDRGVKRNQVWRYPSRHECAQCHSSWAGWALGFNPGQLNRNVGAVGEQAHQLDTWNKAGYFSPPLAKPHEQRKLAQIDDETYPLEYRVRSYLEANCSQCHVNPGPSLAGWDARMATPLSEAQIINGHVVAPRQPQLSWLLARVKAPRDDTKSRMPPIASTLLDTNAIGKIGQWISLLPVAPWTYGDVGKPLMPGSSSSVDNKAYVVSGSGLSDGGVDSGHFLAQPAYYTGEQLVTRVVSSTLTSAVARAGLMIREGRGPSSPFAAVFLRGDGTVSFERRSSTGAIARTSIVSTRRSASWLRLVRSGSRLTGFWSSDGTNWLVAGASDVSLSSAPLAGFAVNSGSATELNVATFDQFSLLGASFAHPLPDAVVTATQPLVLAVAVAAVGRAVSRVDYSSDDTSLGSVGGGGYAILWSYPAPGFHAVTATLSDVSGGGFALPPISLTVQPFAATVVTQGGKTGAGGDWKGSAGSQGHWIAGEVSSLPSDFRAIWVSGEPPFSLGDDSDPRALQRSQGQGRIAKAWSRSNEMILDFVSDNNALRRITTYSVSWQGDGAQQLEWLDPDSGAVLGSWTLSNLAQGRFDSWLLRGSVRLRLIGIAGVLPVLSGVFVDKGNNEAPFPTLQSPANFSRFALPAAVPVKAFVQDLDGSVDRVELLVDNAVVATAFAPSWDFTWTNGLSGWHLVAVRAYDTLGDWRDSAPVFVELTMPSNTAGFVGQDDLTLGNWIGRYGQDGWVIPVHGQILPPSLRVGLVDGFYADPGLVDSDPGWLQHPSLAEERAGGQFAGVLPSSESVPLPVRLTVGSLDGRPHLLSAYFYDPNKAAGPIVTLTDPDTGILLDTRRLSSDGGGRYLQWRFRGRIQIEVNADRGIPFINGLFFDADTNSSPSISLTRPGAGYSNSAPVTVRLSASVESLHPLSKVEFFDGNLKLGEDLQSPFVLDWMRAPAGSHSVWARAVDILGGVGDSIRVPIQLTAAPSSSARFVGEDRKTSGFWIGRYGKEGWQISGFESKLPPYATVEGINYNQFTWNAQSEDPLGLLRPDDYFHVQAVWFSKEDPARIRIGIHDGTSHRVSLYLASYYDMEHHTKVEVWDALGQTLLDSRVLRSLTQPAYVTWDVRGTVELRLSVAAVPGGSQSVWFSGLFFDPGQGALADWLSDHFTAIESANPAIGGLESDPDGDGLTTVWEFGLGTNPRVATSQNPPRISLDGGDLVHTFQRSRLAHGLRAEVDVSSDLETWSAAPPSTVVLSPDDQFESVTTRIPISDVGGVRQFLRLRWFIGE